MHKLLAKCKTLFYLPFLVAWKQVCKLACCVTHTHTSRLHALDHDRELESIHANVVDTGINTIGCGGRARVRECVLTHWS